MSEHSYLQRLREQIPQLSSHSDGLSGTRLIRATLVIALGTFMAVLDTTIANVGLPTIARDLQVDPAASIRVVNAFALPLIAALLPTAALGDAYGFRVTYLVGLFVFTLGSLSCALANSLPLLLAARAFQGIGAAGIVAAGPAMYRTIFPRALLGRGIGISALVVSVSSAAGPLIGGLILAVTRWPWLFAINVPIGIAVCFLGYFSLPRTARGATKLDVTGMLFSATALVTVVLAFDMLSHPRAQPVTVAVMLIASVVCAAIFFRSQDRVSAPLLPPSLFAIVRFRLAALTSLISFTAQGIALISLPFFLRETLHRSALTAALIFSAWPLSISVIAPVAGYLSDKRPPALLSTIGLGIFSAGLIFLGSATQNPVILHVMCAEIVCGLGFGLFQSPNNRELLSHVPRVLTGRASGILSTVRVLGQTLGALTTSLALTLVGAAAMDAGGMTANDLPRFTLGLRTALYAAAFLALVACVISFTRISAARCAKQSSDVSSDGE